MLGNILIVDDDVDVVNLLDLVLAEDGWKVTVCFDAESAIDALSSGDWSVVLSDLHLPGESGLGVVHAVQQYSPETPVIVMTSDATVSVAVDSMREGAFHHLLKPVDLVEIRALVRDARDERYGRRDRSLLQATQAVFGTLDPSDLPQIIVEIALSVLSADYAALVVPGVGGQTISFDARSDIDEPVHPNLTTLVRLCDHASEHLSPISLPNDAEKLPDLQRGLTCVAYPLFSRNVALGALFVARGTGRPSFAQGDVDRASVLAAQISLALDNISLIADLYGRDNSLERARRSITAAERLDGLTRYVTSVAHDLQAPAAYLRTNLRSLDAHFDRLDELASAIESGNLRRIHAAWRKLGGRDAVYSAHQALSYSREGADRIDVIAGDLSRLSRTRDDVAFDLRQTIDSALQMVAGRIRKKVELDLQDAALRGNPGEVCKAIANVVRNAHEAMVNVPDAPITIRSRVSGDTVVVEVSDTGIGIEAKELRRITEPYFTTRTTMSATGLGLSVTRDIVERHRGTLSFESEPGKGTTVRISLPVVDAEVELELGEG